MNDFFENVAEILEVEVELVSEKSDFRTDFPDWDSMKGFALICLIEDDYGVQINVPTFLECKTIGDLFKLTKKE